jgi:hypothetical protein
MFLSACTPLPCDYAVGERTIIETKTNNDGTWIQSTRTVRACME